MTTPNGQLPAAKLSEAAEAVAVDIRFESILRQARKRGVVAPMATEASIRAGNAAMMLGRENAARTLLGRIARHELITED